MTRLVGVRAVCDGCSAAAATTFCVDHQTVLCTNCTTNQHSTPSNSNHHCIDLASAVTALPFCEHCDDAPATVYCQSEGNTLCDKCDRLVHSANPRTHSRTPIESTLRNRAVEFRARARRSPAVNSCPSRPLVAALHADNGFNVDIDMLTEPRKSRTDVSSTASLPQPPPPSSFAQHSNLHPASLRTSPQMRHSAKLLAKRKLRAATRSPQSQPQQQQTLHPSVSLSDPSLSLTTPSESDILNSDQYPAVLFQSGSSAALNTPYPPFGQATSISSSQLIDPLLSDPAVQFRSDQDRQPFIDTPIHNFDPMLTYGVIDLSSSTSLDAFNPSSRSASAQASGDSLQQKPLNPSDSNPPPAALQPTATRFSNDIPDTSVFAAAAAAAAAAGEQYLLNSVSSGSASSRERTSSPLNEAPDPAGVAEAATAAAESTVAASRPMQIVETRMENSGIQSRRAGQERISRSTRRFSEPSIVRGGRGEQAMQRQILEEEMRKLEVESGVGRSGRLGSREYKTNQSRQEWIGTGSEGSNDLGGQMGVDDMMKRESGEGIGELDMVRDEFGFDSMDLVQFERNGYDSPGFSMSDYKTRELDWDEDG